MDLMASNAFCPYHALVQRPAGPHHDHIDSDSKGASDEVLQHLGIKPGEKIELDLLPNGQGMLKAARPAATIDGFVGLLAGRTPKVASLEEINATTALAWAGKA